MDKEIKGGRRDELTNPKINHKVLRVEIKSPKGRNSKPTKHPTTQPNPLILLISSLNNVIKIEFNHTIRKNYDVTIGRAEAKVIYWEQFSLSEFCFWLKLDN